MNYIAEIKAFYDVVMTKQLSTGQIALWHGLMSINNKCAWTERFSVPNLTLELHTGLSKSGVLKARNVLKQYGLIDFKPQGTRATVYHLYSLLANESGRMGAREGVRNGERDGERSGVPNRAPFNKRDQTKEKHSGESKTGFVPPKDGEVREYCRERGNGIDAEAFCDYYRARGWMVGKSKMQDWKAAVRTWERNDKTPRQEEVKYLD